MPAGVLALVLAAAFAHAGWNFLAKGAEGGAGFVWLCAVLGSLIWVPVLAWRWPPTRATSAGWPLGLMVGSGLLHALYFTLLQRGYAAGDLSVVYPLARGTGPLLAGAAAIAFLGERPSALALAGGLIIVAAVFSLVGRQGSREAVLFAVCTGVAIATYTLWDKHAVGPSELSPIVYYWGTNLIIALVLAPWVLRQRRVAAARPPPRGGRRRAEPARLRARAVRARARAGQRGRARARDEHPHRHAAGHHRARGRATATGGCCARARSWSG